MSRFLIATLADAVEAAPGQKFHVMGGGIDSYNAQSFPATATRLALLVALEIEAGTDVETDGTIVCRAPDGNEIFNVSFHIQRAGKFPQPTIVWQGLNLPPITFAGPGRITIEASTPGSTYAFGFEIVGPPTPIFPTPATSGQH